MIARVFPSKTKATPNDELVFFNEPPFFVHDLGITEVHVSVAFGWDKLRAEWLAKQWEDVATVRIGGPAYNEVEGEFVPGRYVKRGYVITSRGCVNRCWFCSVWKRNPELVELPITDGWNVLDDNIMATSLQHQKAVFEMLSKQPERARFTGGIDPKLFTEWHLEQFANINVDSFFFAYDTEDDIDSVVGATNILRSSQYGLSKMKNHKAQCYVLIGYPSDTFDAAEKRLRFIVGLGLTPMAMLFRDYKTGKTDKQWRQFQRLWAKPAIIYSNKREHQSNSQRILGCSTTEDSLGVQK